MDCWQLGLKPIRNLGVVEYNVFQSRPTPTVRKLGHVSSCSLPSSVEDCFQGSLTLCLGLPHTWVRMPQKAYRWSTAGTCWRQPAVSSGTVKISRSGWGDRQRASWELPMLGFPFLYLWLVNSWDQIINYQILIWLSETREFDF